MSITKRISKRRAARKMATIQSLPPALLAKVFGLVERRHG